MTAGASTRRGDVAVTAAGAGLGVSVALTAPYLRGLGGPGAVSTAVGTTSAVIGT